MEIGIRELEAYLSEYVGRVAEGETFTVTDRGQPRALLVPLPGADELARGLAEGWVTRRSTAPPGAAAPARRLARPPQGTGLSGSAPDQSGSTCDASTSSYRPSWKVLTRISSLIQFASRLRLCEPLSTTLRGCRETPCRECSSPSLSWMLARRSGMPAATSRSRTVRPSRSGSLPTSTRTDPPARAIRTSS